MEVITQLHFIRPMILLALPLVLLIVWYLQKSQSSDDGWSKICDPHLLDAIKINKGGKGSKWSLLLWPIALISVLAVAGPAFRKLPTPVIKNQSALIVALDVSNSMLADDIKPNRLERAKYKINDILAKRKDGQTALIVYAGDAFVVTPLTDDTETIALMLKAISPDIMPAQGSRADIALKKAKDLLKQAGYAKGEILLISDGVNSSKAKRVANELTDNRIRVSVLAIGTKQGAPIPTQTGFLKDSNGNIVVPKLDVASLKEVAQSGNGRFAQITGDSADIDYLVPTIAENDEGKDNDVLNANDEFDTEKYIDEGPWLTLLLLPLFALLFRKGLLLSLFLVVGLQTPGQSYAFEWQDMWLNADQKAVKQINQGKLDDALQTAKSDTWKAAAAYKKKDFNQAQDLFNKPTLDGLYNKGNALAQSGKLEEAIASYDEALKLNPTDEDTLFNKKQVEEALKKQQEQQKKEQENKDKQDKDKQDKENKDSEEKDKKDQDQKKQDQENKEQESKDQEQKDGEGENQEGEQKDKQDNPEQKDGEKKEEQMSEEEKEQQKKEKEALEKADKEAQEKKEKEAKEVKMTPEEMAQDAEKKEAIEQWLRRIPDDPGGLLRRKFYYQYNQQNKKPDEQENW